MKVELDINKTATRIAKRIKKSQFLLDQQVLKDSNFYVPEDTGNLQDSGVLGTSGGEVKWDSIYAKKQYYEDNKKSKDRNPNASMKWFEVAKGKQLKIWEKIANDKYNE